MLTIIDYNFHIFKSFNHAQFILKRIFKRELEKLEKRKIERKRELEERERERVI